MLKRIAASALNIALIAVAGDLLAENGLGSDPKPIEFLLVGVVFGAPLFSLYALWSSNKDGWLSLYLRRKAMEEQKRIDEISSNRKAP